MRKWKCQVLNHDNADATLRWITAVCVFSEAVPFHTPTTNDIARAHHANTLLRQTRFTCKWIYTSLLIQSCSLQLYTFLRTKCVCTKKTVDVMHLDFSTIPRQLLYSLDLFIQDPQISICYCELPWAEQHTKENIFLSIENFSILAI
jgi:hypothetical protein